MKPLPLVAFALLCSTLSYAQSITLMPKIGGSMSTISFSKDLTGISDVKNKFGFIGGLAIEIPAGNKIAIQPEILFHQKGWKENAVVNSIAFDGTFTLNYIEIPVLAKLKLGAFYINAGPSIAFGIGGNYDFHASSGKSSSSQSGKIKFGKPPSSGNPDDIYFDNSFDIGIQAGVGVVIAHHVVIDLRYGIGMKNLFDEDEQNGINDNKSKLRSLQLTVAAPIKLGRI